MNEIHRVCVGVGMLAVLAVFIAIQCNGACLAVSWFLNLSPLDDSERRLMALGSAGFGVFFAAAFGLVRAGGSR